MPCRTDPDRGSSLGLVSPKIATEDLIDAHGVAEILELSLSQTSARTNGGTPICRYPSSIWVEAGRSSGSARTWRAGRLS